MELSEIDSVLKSFRLNYKQLNYNLIEDYIDFYTYKSYIEQNEYLLNKLWCIKNILYIKKEYVETFEKLKQDKFHEAWCSFYKIEEQYKSLINIYDNEKDEYDINFIYEYTKKFQKFFPYKYFLSPEFLIKKFKCSICGKTYRFKRKCKHKPGQLYNGKFCSKICLDMEILNVAIVKKPSDKCTVLFKKDRDNYNYALIKSLTVNLDSPFHEWDYTISETLEPHYKFNEFKEEDLCPCGSGKTYNECCLKQDGVTMKKFNVTYHVMPNKGKFDEYSNYFIN